MFDITELKRMLDVLVSQGISHVFFGGGEPLLHPALPDAYAYGKRLGMEMTISTNGHLITQRILDALYNAGLTHDFSVSLDGPDEETNSRIRGKGAFLPTLRGMYELAKHGRIVWGVNFVSTRPNLGTALQTVLLSQRLGASYFNLIRFTPFGRGLLHKETLLISDEEFRVEENAVSARFPCLGIFYGDIYLYDLAGVSRFGITSYFDAERFQRIPSGVSIGADGQVELTPAAIPLGNCKRDGLEAVLRRLDDDEIFSLYTDWLAGKRQGIHQPK